MKNNPWKRRKFSKGMKSFGFINGDADEMLLVWHSEKSEVKYLSKKAIERKIKTK